MPDIAELNTKLDALGSAWEQFKKSNDDRLKEIEKKGTPDALTTKKVDDLNAEIDRLKGALDSVETKLNRPIKGDDGAVSLTPEAEAHKKAFINYLRKGVEDGLEELQKKTMSVGSDPDGGYFVTPEKSSEIIKIIRETSPMRQIASVETISSDYLEVSEDRDEASVGWVGETEARDDTDTPQVGMKKIPVHEIYAQPKVTQKLLDDASVNIEAWLAEKVSDAFYRTENTAFFTGDGNNKPRGLLTIAAGTSWGQVEQKSSGTNGDFDADDLIDLFYRLKEGYAVNAKWLMSRASVKKARLLKENTTNQYIWQPGLKLGEPDTLCGAPLVQCADMPDPSTNSLSVAVGDFKRAYQIVDRFGIRVLRDPFTAKPFVRFYTTKRVGGDVKNYEAYKLLKLAN